MDHDEFWKACEPGELRRGQHIKFDPQAPDAVHASFNVTQEGLREPEWFADFLASLPGVKLAPERRDALVTLLRSMPPGTTMSGVIDRIKKHEAEQLGISPENYDALAPLFEALMSGMFDRIEESLDRAKNGDSQNPTRLEG
jgi:hypothetical protein